jgi:hypothetical protein
MGAAFGKHILRRCGQRAGLFAEIEASLRVL